MSECVKETECTNCSHKMVCSIKENYLKLFEKFQGLYDDKLFSVKIHCKNYSYGAVKIPFYTTYYSENEVMKKEQFKL